MQQTTQHLVRHRPRHLFGWRYMAASAVVILLRQIHNEPYLFMIQRAKRQGDPWSGDMAFPGGRREKQDTNILATAKRELTEETGFVAEEGATLITRLGDQLTRAHENWRPMVVTPFVFALHDGLELTSHDWAFNHEVADQIWIPLRYFSDNKNRQSMQYRVSRINVTLPCYFYQQKRIWGLSLRMIDELVRASRTKPY